MSEKLYKAIIPEGKHLASSRNTKGAYRGGLLDNDNNQISGQAEFVEVGSDDRVEAEHVDSVEAEYSNDESNNILENALLVSVGISIGIAAYKAYPHVKSWCKKTFSSKSKDMYCSSTDQQFSTFAEHTNGEAPNYVKSFNAALHTYLDAAEKGQLKIEIIDAVITSLDELKSNYDTGNITIEFSMSQLTTIMNIILNNTNILAERKLIRLDAFTQTSLEDNSELGRLKHCLEVQKQILEVA